MLVFSVTMLAKKPVKKEPVRYAVFLRGINVGGKTLKMDVFKDALASLGLRDVKTILASGNAVCAGDGHDAATLAAAIEAKLIKVSGLQVRVLLRTVDALQKLADTAPFKVIKVTPATRRFVTFLSEKPKAPLSSPHPTSDKNFRIVRESKTELCWAILDADLRTVDFMTLIERVYGKNVTTRNWNTIEKILRT